ncbi:MAG: DUF1697 domain-containing protein [Solirubrobacteraceae bacterium]
MSRYAAFLRGMNVGGHRLTNEELRAHFDAMGFVDVATFRASGNVVFAGEKAKPALVRSRIEEGLSDLLGYGVPAFIRTAEEVRGMAAKQPFPAKQVSASEGKLQVALLFEKPAAAAARELGELSSKHDRLLLDGRELYWLPSGGVLESALDMKRIERLLGAMTMRTKGTIEQIAAKHFAD